MLDIALVSELVLFLEPGAGLVGKTETRCTTLAIMLRAFPPDFTRLLTFLLFLDVRHVLL